jgi:Zn-finger protein
MKLETVKCYICNHDESSPWSSEDGFRVVKCRDCGLVSMDPRPSANEIMMMLELVFTRPTMGLLTL